MKLELKLCKQVQNVNWISLEAGHGKAGAIQAPVAVNPVEKKAKPYASSKNWDKIDQDLKKEIENEKPEGEAALNGLFK